MINEIEFILYVEDQERSKQFYSDLFQLEPTLHVPGITEFRIGDGCKLGIMPEEGISSILSDKTPHPSLGNGIPRCELYLRVNNIADYFNRAVTLGAKQISPVQMRDWGDNVGYLSDLDGHVIAFTENQ